MSKATPTLDPGAFGVRSVEDWLTEWPPQRGAAQWRDGKSAKELAKAWFPPTGGPVIPPGLRRLLESHPATAAMRIEHAQGEKVVPLDDFKGETRNSDLVLTGSSQRNRVIVHVEAKADEPFGSNGRSVADAARAATSPRSKVPERIANISGLLFGSREVSPAVGALNYQLFYSVAGALMDAEEEGAEFAMFVVHELIPRDLTHRFKDENDGIERVMNAAQIAANRAVFAQFLDALVGTAPNAVCHGGVLWEIGGFRPFVDGRWSGTRIKRPITLLLGKATDWTA